MDCLIYPGPDFGTEILVCDDCSQFIDLGFTFPFYGNDYTGVFVNSNGNLTFNLGDDDYTQSFSEFINEEPRIAPFWIDLNPTFAPEEGGVFYKQLSDRFVVTWVQVPIWGSGIPPYNTFQVVLYDTGRIGFAYSYLDNIALEDYGLYDNFPLIGVAEGGGGNSCIFKYDPPENYDPDETVDGPEGFLDGKQLFFDFVGSECTLTVRSCVSRGILPTIL